MDLITQGLVLRETQYKEQDKILTLLTKDFGKLTAKAQGCYRNKSPLAASAQLLVWSELRIVDQRGQLLVKEGDSLNQFWGVRRDLEKLYLASYFAEVVELVSQEGESHQGILSLILNALYALDQLNKPLSLIKSAFELKLISCIGYEPLLESCTVCGAEQPVKPSFDVEEGVLFCQGCIQGSGSLKPLDESSVNFFRHVVYGSPKRLFSCSVTPEGLALAGKASEAFLLAQLGRGFYTLDLYKGLGATPLSQLRGNPCRGGALLLPNPTEKRGEEQSPSPTMAYLHPIG